MNMLRNPVVQGVSASPVVSQSYAQQLQCFMRAMDISVQSEALTLPQLASQHPETSLAQAYQSINAVVDAAHAGADRPTDPMHDDVYVAIRMSDEAHKLGLALKRETSTDERGGLGRAPRCPTLWVGIEDMFTNAAFNLNNRKRHEEAAIVATLAYSINLPRIQSIGHELAIGYLRNSMNETDSPAVIDTKTLYSLGHAFAHEPSKGANIINESLLYYHKRGTMDPAIRDHIRKAWFHLMQHGPYGSCTPLRDASRSLEEAASLMADLGYDTALIQSAQALAKDPVLEA